jgi:hypothetical protein
MNMHSCYLDRHEAALYLSIYLSSDTHRQPITSITAALLTFVAYLLILPFACIVNAIGGNFASVVAFTTP